MLTTSLGSWPASLSMIMLHTLCLQCPHRRTCILGVSVILLSHHDCAYEMFKTSIPLGQPQTHHRCPRDVSACSVHATAVLNFLRFVSTHSVDHAQNKSSKWKHSSYQGKYIYTVRAVFLTYEPLLH